MPQIRAKPQTKVEPQTERRSQRGLRMQYGLQARNVELKVFATDGAASEGTFIQPGGAVQTLRVEGTSVVGNPLAGRVTWRVTRPPVTGMAQ